MVHQHVPGEASFEHAGVAAARADISAGGARVGVVVARFNQRITSALYAGAVQVLLDAGVDATHIMAVQVPGAVELPLAARELATAARCDAVVALGCVIRGDTAHFDYVCQAATDGCLRVQLDTGVPIGFGVITCDTAEQALARASDPGAQDAQSHNVGADAARAALEMVGLLRQIG